MYAVALVMSILCPPFGLILGFYGLNKEIKNWKVYIFCIAFAIGTYAYCYKPFGDPDLVRYIAYVERIGKYSLKQAFELSYLDISTLRVFTFFCWICGRIGEPHLLPAISTFWVYYIGLYVTCKVGYDYKARRFEIVSYIIFLMMTLNFYGIVNNVRNVLAFCIIGFATFKDCYEGKKNIWTYFLYIMPLFLHESAIVFLLLRILVGKTNRIKLVSMATMAFMVSIVQLSFQYVHYFSGSNIISTLVRSSVIKAYQYFMDTDSAWGAIVQNSIQERMSKIVYVSLALFFCIISYVTNRKLKEKIDKGTERILDLCFNISLFVIACAPMRMPEYWRFASAMIVFSGVLYLVVLTRYDSKNVRILMKLIFLWAPISVAFWIRRILYSDLISLLWKPFISSPVFVFFEKFFDMIF